MDARGPSPRSAAPSERSGAAGAGLGALGDKGSRTKAGRPVKTGTGVSVFAELQHNPPLGAQVFVTLMLMLPLVS